MNDSATPKPKLRWYQYKLRTLLVLMTLAAIFCSWYACEMRNAAERRSSIERIIELGGDVRYYEVDVPYRLVALDSLGAPPRWYSWLRKAYGDEYLGNCLGVRGAPITDAGLVNLKGLTKLESLALWDTQITDAGLVHLKGLTKLESLELWGSQITDAGLVNLKGLTKLESLVLSHTQITDAGLVHLKGLANLKYLNLLSTQVTDEGRKKLQEALPNCAIQH